jgi:hypothetical protein
MAAGLRWEYGPSCISAIVGSLGVETEEEALEITLAVAYGRVTNVKIEAVRGEVY